MGKNYAVFCKLKTVRLSDIELYKVIPICQKLNLNPVNQASHPHILLPFCFAVSDFMTLLTKQSQR